MCIAFIYVPLEYVLENYIFKEVEWVALLFITFGTIASKGGKEEYFPGPSQSISAVLATFYTSSSTIIFIAISLVYIY